MKTTGLLFIFFLVSNSILSQNDLKGDTAGACYPDGQYTGISRAIYEAEPYWGILRMKVREGKITGLTFMIRDSSLHETFNEEYARHFAGNALYIQQTRNDWNGVRTYPAILMDRQDINKVDVITGATWSYNIFRESFKEALKNKY